MIDQFNGMKDTEDEAFDVLAVRASTGRLVGVYWGSREEICDAVDEVTDPNECECQACEPGGMQFGCFLDGEEISVQEFAKQEQAAMAADEDDDEDIEMPEISFEGLSQRSFDIFSADYPWHPLVPRGYQYIAGFGLQKIASEWN